MLADRILESTKESLGIQVQMYNGALVVFQADDVDPPNNWAFNIDSNAMTQALRSYL